MKIDSSSRRNFLVAGGVAASAGVALADSPFAPFPPGLSKNLLIGCTSDPVHERVLIRYTRGSGQLSEYRQFIYLHMQMFQLDGRADGFHDGVWQALFNDPSQLLAVPPQTLNPLTAPVAPVEPLAPLANTVAHWTFGDGSRLYADGPALSHLVLLKNRSGQFDGSTNFSVCCSQILTEGGTGFFQGAHGLKQSLGATAVPAGVNFFTDPVVAPFVATTLDTFRIVWPEGVPAGFDKAIAPW